MSAASRTDAEAGSQPGPPRRSWRRFLARGVLLYAVLPYVGVTAVLGMIQRALIYHPTRYERPLEAEDAGLEPGRVTTVRTETHDGLTLNGWHVRPAGEVAEEGRTPRWLVLYFHGNAGNRQMRVRDCLDFTELGADVWLFDYRGYGDNPGSPGERDLVRDARSIWDTATGEHGVPPERIVVYGESIGGGVAIHLVSDLAAEGVRPAALVASSTFSSLPDTAAWLYPWLPVRWVLVERYPSERLIPEVTCPILLIHGTRDEIVPIGLGRKLFAAAPEESQEGIAKRFVELPGRGHNDITKAEFRESVGELLAKVEHRRNP